MTDDGMSRDEDRKARNWGMLCHLIALCGLLGVPFGHILGPLVVWLIKRNDFPIVDEQGKESLNFQISFTIYALVSAILVFFVVGFVLLIGFAIADLVFVIIASVKVGNGQPYRYPLTIRFIK